MSKATDGYDLTRVGPGTVMGEMMRQYWIPAAASSELKPDGNPMRLMLLGEALIAFRDSSGRVGVLDHQCPHRCASLFLGRNEENGIRCIYHGWKFDVDGRCLEMPNVLAPEGEHRYCRLDREAHRKCWYVRALKEDKAWHSIIESDRRLSEPKRPHSLCS
jgi:phenylpropionate dioxygenase-like ring-hydroxylating dioxygenase large terminal subunit